MLCNIVFNTDRNQVVCFIKNKMEPRTLLFIMSTETGKYHNIQVTEALVFHLFVSVSCEIRSR